LLDSLLQEIKVMGCDGGTIPTRDELVKLKKKPEQKDSDGHRIYKWQHCAITQQVLSKPIVACEMGRLYNKESVIELLLSEDRTSAPRWTDHIKQLKDVVELQLTPNPAYSDSSRRQDAVGDGMYVDRLVAPWICPVTGLEMNGRFKFVLNIISGRVVAERAVKVLRQDPTEGSNFQEEDMIILNPEEEELDMMNANMIARRARVKAAKKAAKAAKKLNKETTPSVESSASKEIISAEETSGSSSEFKVPASATPCDSEPVPKKAKTEGNYSDQKEVRKEGKKKEKKLHLEKEGDKKVFNMFAEQAAREKKDAERPAKDMNFVKRSTDLSAIKNMKPVQESGHSEIYKKLFTTHKDAINQPKGNWVTFDPRYN